jgi:hypothetical protein
VTVEEGMEKGTCGGSLLGKATTGVYLRLNVDGFNCSRKEIFAKDR